MTMTDDELDLVEIDREAAELAEETWIGARQARVVVLRQRGVPYDRIATIMGIERGTVARHLHDVRRQYAEREGDLAWLRDRGYDDMLDHD
jgi:DNA-directed RNA polymerase specialized sigma24 family protein